MTSMFPRILLAVGLAATILSACGTPAPQHQLTVDGQPVPLSLYTTLVSAEQQKIERTGARIDWQSTSGKDRLARIESAVIRELVRDAVVEALARTRGITVGAADLQQTVAATEQAFGGAGGFEQGLEQAGLTRSNFEALLRYRVLEARLRQADSAGIKAAIEKAVSKAHVVVSIGPCDPNHGYPACLTP